MSCDSALETPNMSRADAADHLLHRIGQVPIIVERVFRHLPMRDLNNCSKVCKMWNKICRVVKKNRSQLSWMFWISLSMGISKKGPVVEIVTHISSVLRQIFSHPKRAILFATNAFFDDQAMFMKSNSDSDTPMVDHLVAQLPQDCLLLGTSSDGIIGTSVTSDGCFEVENKPGFTCLLLPDIPGVDVYPFVINDLQDIPKASTRQSLTDEELVKLTKIPPNTKVKSVVFFCTEVQKGGKAARLITESLLIKQKRKLAFGGGFADTLVTPKHMLSEHMYLPHTVGIAFCGEKVQAASIMLSSSVQDKESVHNILKQLKSCALPEDKSFAFMFACVGRGEGHYKEGNVEADLFRQVFPKTPLFGFFGNGEIGLNSLLSSKDLPQDKHVKTGREKLFNSYTTVIVLISIVN